MLRHACGLALGKGYPAPFPTFYMSFVSLGESWFDTISDIGRLMLTIMGGIATCRGKLPEEG